MGEVIPFVRAVLATANGPWTAAERVELARLAAAITRDGLLGYESNHGLTDTGEPWFAIAVPRTGETVLHVARISGRFVLHHVVDDEAEEGGDLGTVIRRALRDGPRGAELDPGAALLMLLLPSMTSLTVAASAEQPTTLLLAQPGDPADTADWVEAIEALAESGDASLPFVSAIASFGLGPTTRWAPQPGRRVEAQGSHPFADLEFHADLPAAAGFQPRSLPIVAAAIESGSVPPADTSPTERDDSPEPSPVSMGTEPASKIAGAPIRPERMVKRIEGAGRSAEPIVLLEGTETHDHLVGGEGRDIVFAGAGDDLIEAGAGRDIVFSGDGDDTASGAGGKDRMRGGRGEDRMSGDGGADAMNGGADSDMLNGGLNDDEILGMASHDWLLGEEGGDTLRGDTGRDLLQGGTGHDRAAGGGGADLVFGDAGDDSLNGNEGDDTLVGGGGNDLLVGSEGRDELFGGGGDDTLAAGQGPGVVIAGPGTDEIIVGVGQKIWGGAGADLFKIDSDSYTPDGRAHAAAERTATIFDFSEADGDMLQAASGIELLVQYDLDDQGLRNGVVRILFGNTEAPEHQPEAWLRPAPLPVRDAPTFETWVHYGRTFDDVCG